MRRFEKIIRDPIYGYIGVTDEELKIIELPLFQRLRRISQLSFVNLVYPGANHTRFSHSLGVLHLAGVIGSIFKEMGYIDDDEAIILRWAGLLHDIGHGPFSHAFEPVLAQFILRDGEPWTEAHIRYGQKLIYNTPEIYKKIGGKDVAKRVCGLISGKEYQGEKTNELMKSIMTGFFSIDRLDYLKRDAHHAGTPEYGIIDADRILNSFLWDKKFDNVYYSKKGVYALAGAILSYFNMYQAIYFHHATRAAYCLCQHILWDAFSQGIFKNTDWKELWQNFDDFKCLEIIYTKGSNDIKEKISLLLNRKLPKRILDSSDFTTRSDLKIKIGHLQQPAMYPQKMEVEERIRKQLNIKTFYIDSPEIVPYPCLSREPPFPPLIALDEEQPSSSNKLLHEIATYLTGLQAPPDIIRIYMEEIWKNDDEKLKLKDKVLDALAQNIKIEEVKDGTAI